MRLLELRVNVCRLLVKLAKLVGMGPVSLLFASNSCCRLHETSSNTSKQGPKSNFGLPQGSSRASEDQKQGEQQNNSNLWPTGAA